MLARPPRATDPIVPWRDVLGLFGLPSPLHAPDAVVGGWSHSVWRVETLEGVYAIKEMLDNPAGWWIEQLDTAIAFELTAWRSGTIAMAEPIPVAGSDQLLGRLDAGHVPRRYRCHRWVEGQPCLDLPPNVERSARVGVIVAALAQLDVQGGTTADRLPWNALDAYDDTVAEAMSKRLDWAHALAELRPFVTKLREDFIDLADRAKPTAVVHRDIDPKNTSLRIDNEVALFDWDYAGPRLIASELLDAALSFAGGVLDVEAACFLATIDSYRESGGPPVDFSDAAPPLIEEGFRWIMLNAWRCLGHRGVSPEQESFAASVVRALAPTWPDSVTATQTWGQWVVDRVQ